MCARTSADPGRRPAVRRYAAPFASRQSALLPVSRGTNGVDHLGSSVAGAVINRDFNYRIYLDELRDKHLDLTRTWAGAYRKASGNFRIVGNTCAPEPSAFIAPWPRSSQAGAADGLNKFDLKQWNPAYFERLQRLCDAGEHAQHCG